MSTVTVSSGVFHVLAAKSTHKFRLGRLLYSSGLLFLSGNGGDGGSAADLSTPGLS